MGRAILIVSLIVVCSFIFVALQLRSRMPAGAVPSAGPTPVLETREDGSIYSVGLRIERLEQRLVESEKRTVELEQALTDARGDRAGLQQQVKDLEGRVEKLKQDLEKVSSPPDTSPANVPSTLPGPGTVPVPPGVGTPGTSPVTPPGT